MKTQGPGRFIQSVICTRSILSKACVELRPYTTGKPPSGFGVYWIVAVGMIGVVGTWDFSVASTLAFKRARNTSVAFLSSAEGITTSDLGIVSVLIGLDGWDSV